VNRQRTLWIAAAGLIGSLALAACGSRAGPADEAQSTVGQFTVLAGSELKDLEPALVKAAREAGVNLKLAYAGTLDTVERVNAGETFDAILPANGAYPALALAAKPLAREKLFYSRVALGVKAAKLGELGWDKHPPTWADIASAAGAGRLRYAMTNPTSSNTGMSALFAVASAVAGKTEDLGAKEVNPKVLKAFLSGQKLTAGSSGWLAEAYVKNPGALDAMVNYEAVIERSNSQLARADQLVLVYPKDGVISADYPLMLLDATRKADYDRLVAAFRTPAFQAQVVAPNYLRPSLAGVPPAAGLSVDPVAELSFPNSLDVIDEVLSAYQGELRRASTSIFVLDVSGSMAGARLAALKQSMEVLAGADASSATARYARFQNRERVVLMAFSNVVQEPVWVNFDKQALDAGRAQVVAYAGKLATDGGTAIYDALARAEAIAGQEHARAPERFVSIVLLTDGENNTGANFEAFRRSLAAGVPAPVFPILFGESNTGQMEALAQFTGGRSFDGRKSALALVFKEIRGYQ
jgi:Ca-activated chloride channel family protein